MQESLLSIYPNAPIHVYAVWTPILGRDTREGWNPTLLYDRRVVHLWDPDNDIPRHLGLQPEFADFGSRIVWDAYALFAGDARWDEPARLPFPLEGRGWTVISHSLSLAVKADPLLSPWRRVFVPLVTMYMR